MVFVTTHTQLIACITHRCLPRWGCMKVSMTPGGVNCAAEKVRLWHAKLRVMQRPAGGFTIAMRSCSSKKHRLRME